MFYEKFLEVGCHIVHTLFCKCITSVLHGFSE